LAASAPPGRRFPSLASPKIPLQHRAAFGLFVVTAAFSLAAAITAGCSAQDAAMGSAAGGGDNAGGYGPAATGAGGTEQDASLDIGTERGDDAGYDPAAPYAGLCGDGVCKPGDEAKCQAGQDGGGGDGSLSCKLLPEGGVVVATCATNGPMEITQPCQTSADCAAGLGCASGNTCRPYCCGDVELCPVSTYCAPIAMAEDPNAPPAAVPMCIAATNCTLLTDGACPVDQTCTIVREDGTTSCVVPGTGESCEPCDCAAGYVCSKATNQCRKLCRIDKDDCPGGYCQAGSMNYPQGFGVCVGGEQDC
jgi:hypothetical protein